MGASFSEFKAYLGMFPSLADSSTETAQKMYSGLCLAERGTGAEVMDYLKYRFYDKTPAEWDEYLTRRQYAFLAGRVNSPMLCLELEDKGAFDERFSGFLGRDFVVACEGEKERFLKLCAQNERLVVKPRRGGYGRGIRIVDTDDPERLWELCSADECVVETLIVQHDDMALVHPSSVNSVRVVTALDRAGYGHVLAAALRCGRDGSITDSGNGLFAGVDLATGVVNTDGVSHFSERFACHPDSGVQFQGMHIPNWEGLVVASKAVAEENPSLRLMNWDWACRKDGAWCLIEGNFTGGLGPCQEAGDQGLARTVYEHLGLQFGRL